MSNFDDLFKRLPHLEDLFKKKEEKEEEEEEEKKDLIFKKKPGEESTGKSKRTDSKKNLEELYWEKRMSETQIMYEINYNSSQEVMNKILKWGIPVRGPDRKVLREFKNQYGVTTPLREAQLNSNGATITTESLNTKQFRNFQLVIGFNKTGTPTNAYVRIQVQLSFDEDLWFDLKGGSWGFLIESEDTIPVDHITSIGSCPADFIRIVFTGNGGLLNATNYFIIQEAHIVLS